MTTIPDRQAEALRMARSAIDRLMGDSDLPDDDSYEMRAMTAINEALRAYDARPKAEG